MKRITLTIDGVAHTAEAGETVLDVTRRAGCDVPTLCHDDRVDLMVVSRLREPPQHLEAFFTSARTTVALDEAKLQSELPVGRVQDARQRGPQGR